MHKPTADELHEHETITPVAFTPITAAATRQKFKPGKGLVIAGLLLLAIIPILYFLFAAKSIAIATSPPAEEIDISGGVVLPLGQRYLLLPGEYKLHAWAKGYSPLAENIRVDASGGADFSFAFSLLPDLWRIASTPVVNAAVTLDGKAIGQTPLAAVEVPAGEHRLEISAPRYQPYAEVLTSKGGGTEHELIAALTPAWSDVTFTSNPQGATITVDDEELGTTPATLEVLTGKRELRLKLAGHKAWQGSVDIPANQSLELPLAQLQVADGLLMVSTQPGKANILVNGQFSGQSPRELSLAPGKSYQIEAHKPGYLTAKQKVTIVSGKEQSLTLSLQENLGEIIIKPQPDDAQILVNGQPAVLTNGKIQLAAVPQRITVSKPGYVNFETTITPKPGFVQQIDARLKTSQQAKLEAVKPQITTAAGQSLKLIKPGRFTMGASRREPGRRANEALRNINLTRWYYLATTEVTNAQFRQFRSGHTSGKVDSYSLDGDDQPVVNITWLDAARYCNWLSQRDDLQPAYNITGDQFTGFDPKASGYRLPTEAEWDFAARGNGTGDAVKYPWGNQFPPTGKAGNYADGAAASLLGQLIADYNDGFAVSAPVASFPANALGMYDLGGNVAEWIHDYYGQMAQPGEALETDPLGPAEGTLHVIRGASWRHGTVVELRLSFRDYGDKPRDDAGFRIARYAD